MLRILLFLTVIITAVYSDCCTNAVNVTNAVTNKCGNNTDDVDCHLEYYGIHCCNEEVLDSVALFANDSHKILQRIQPLEDNIFSNSNTFNGTIDSLLQNFNSICKRYTIAMATKHRLQDHMLTNLSDNNLIDAVIYLETAALRLQQIQKLHTNTTCLEFTSRQYLMYIYNYDKESIKTSLEEWATTKGNCCGQWNKGTEIS